LPFTEDGMTRSPQSTNGAPHSLPGADDITRQALPNGITVLCRPNFNSPSVNVSGYLPVGALLDPPEKLGLADFTASSLMRGAARRSFQQIYDDLESVGASFGFSGGTHSTGFGGKALAEDLDLLLGVLAETLQSPAFPAEQVERLRAQILTHLAIRAQDTGDMAALTFDQIVYAGHPYRHPEEGFPETVQAIARDDLARFHQASYGPQGMVIAIVGAVAPGEAVEKASRALGGWSNPLQPELPALPALAPLAQTTTRKAAIPGKSQADLVVGVAGPPRKEPDFIAASLGNNILGQFGMYGRIGDVVREREGLAYYAYSSLSGGIGPGPWYVSAGVDPGKVTAAVELIFQEIRRFTSQPVEAHELEDSQANYIGRLPLSMESNGGVASALLNLERYELGLDYYRQYEAMIRAVTPAAILDVARRYLDPERAAVAIAGP
jgi:zinc protease